MDRNLYDVLGIQKNASQEDIKKAFKELALKFHPDRNPGDISSENQFKDVNEAYQTLSDVTKKANYDLRESFSFGYQTRANTRSGTGPNISDFRKAVEDMFGRTHGRTQGAQNTVWGSQSTQATQQPQEGTWHPSHDIPGEDIETSVEITLKESISGCKKPIKIHGNRSSPCKSCGGTGGQPGARTIVCSSCAGRGSGVSPNGMSASIRKCIVCRGRGKVPLALCEACLGHGLETYAKEVTVSIPAGIENGQQLRISGRGNPGHPPGDLYISVRITDDGKFRRNGMDIHCNVKVTLKQAILGGYISINGPDDSNVDVKIPPGTQPGDEVKISGAGVKGAHLRGDFVVHVTVDLPKVLSPRGEKLLDELFNDR